MMRRRYLLVGTLVALVACSDLVAPSDATIALQVGRSSLVVPDDSAFVTAVVLDGNGEAVAEHTCITVTTSLGMLRRPEHPNTADKCGGDDPVGNGFVASVIVPTLSGVATAVLRTVADTGTATVSATSGKVKAETQVEFVAN